MNNSTKLLKAPIKQNGFCVIITVFILFQAITVSSQPFHFTEPHGQLLHDYSKEILTEGWIYIYDSINVYNNTFVDEFFSELGLGTFDSLELVESVLDPEETAHINKYALHEYYEQLYKGIRVEDAELAIHSLDSMIYLINGKLVDSLNISFTGIISDETALDSALAYIDAEVYSWEVDSTEIAPMPELIISHPPGTPIHESNYLPCYLITIKSEDPYINADVYVNAYNGSIEFMKSNIYECNGAQGTGVTNFYQTQDIDIRERQNDFTLENCDRNIHAKDFGGDIFYWILTDEITDNDEDYHGAIQAVSAFWSASQTHEIYDNVFGLEGMDDDNCKVKLYINNGHEINGPRFEKPNRIYCGRFPDFNTLDVIAHEFTHGVIHHSSRLGYDFEPGALNESFCDIFGKVIEWHVANIWSINGINHAAITEVTFDWLMANDGGDPQRSLQNPGLFDHPRIYQGDNWYPTDDCEPEIDDEQCGVHINNGVQNHWFFLLTQGQSGPEAHPHLTGLGMRKSSRIAFRNLTKYIQSNSQYVDAREGAIRSTIDLFGPCSTEDYQNRIAWSEVGLGDTPNWCADLRGSTKICLRTEHADQVGDYWISTLNEADITWSNLNPSWTYTITGNNGQHLIVTDWGNSSAISNPCTNITATITYDGVTIVKYIKVCFYDCENEIPESQSTSIEESVSSPMFSIYPNPIQSFFFVESRSESGCEFILTDVFGRELMRDEVNPGPNNFTLNSNISPGIYFLTFRKDEKVQSINNVIVLNR